MQKSIFSKIIMLSIELRDGSEIFIVRNRAVSQEVENTFKTIFSNRIDSIEVELLESDPRLAQVTLESFGEKGAVTSTTRIFPTTSLTWTQTEDENAIKMFMESVKDKEVEEQKELAQQEEQEKNEEKQKMIPTRI